MAGKMMIRLFFSVILVYLQWIRLDCQGSNNGTSTTPSTACCPKKRVGPDLYTLVGPNSTEAAGKNCEDDCMYTLEGTSDKYCFAPGNLQVKCSGKSKLELEVEELKGVIEEQKGVDEELKGVDEELKGVIEVLKKLLQEMQAELNAQKANVTKLQADVSSQSVKNLEFRSELNETETELLVQETEIEQNSDGISDADVAISANSDGISDADAAITANSAAITSNSDGISDADAAITGNSAAITSNSDKVYIIDYLTNSIGENMKKISANKLAIKDNSKRLAVCAFQNKWDASDNSFPGMFATLKYDKVEKEVAQGFETLEIGNIDESTGEFTTGQSGVYFVTVSGQCIVGGALEGMTVFLQHSVEGGVGGTGDEEIFLEAAPTSSLQSQQCSASRYVTLQSTTADKLSLLVRNEGMDSRLENLTFCVSWYSPLQE